MLLKCSIYTLAPALPVRMKILYLATILAKLKIQTTCVRSRKGMSRSQTEMLTTRKFSLDAVRESHSPKTVAALMAEAVHHRNEKYPGLKDPTIRDQLHTRRIIATKRRQIFRLRGPTKDRIVSSSGSVARIHEGLRIKQRSKLSSGSQQD
jgi:hypothetical protein